MHAGTFFLYGHDASTVNGLCNSRQVVWVYHQGAVLQFSGGAGELADDHYTCFIYLGGTEFLGDEVHSVFK